MPLPGPPVSSLAQETFTIPDFWCSQAPVDLHICTSREDTMHGLWRDCCSALRFHGVWRLHARANAEEKSMHGWRG